MNKATSIICLLFASVFLHAQAGTFTVSTVTYDGLERTYGIYEPLNLEPNPDIIYFLPGTFLGTAALEPSQMPLSAYHGIALDRMGDQHKFVVIEPMGTWVAGGLKGGRRFWHSDGTDAYFPAGAPDDSGFLRWLLLEMQTRYSPRRQYWMGMSSGGMMTESFCRKNADLVTACAVMSGSLYVGPPITLAAPSRPVNMRFERGTADVTIGFGPWTFSGWGPPGKVAIPGVDADLNWWLQSMGLPPNPVPLWSNGAPAAGFNHILNFYSADRTINVQFVERVGGVHDIPQWQAAEAVEWLLER